MLRNSGASQIVVFVKRGKFGEPTNKAMTKEEYLAIASSKYDELQALRKIDNFYDYEKEFDKLLRELGRTLFEKTLSEVPADRRKKKHSQNSGTSK